MKIILVEDHAVLADMSCRELREVHEHDVRHAASAAEALKQAERSAPDLMLIDMNLPDMDGYELAERLRANPALSRTIFVALTGWGSLVDDARAQAAGFDRHFRKPMDFGLLSTIERKAAGRSD